MTAMKMSMILVMYAATTELSVLTVSSMEEAKTLNIVRDDPFMGQIRSDENYVPGDEGAEIPQLIRTDPADYDEDLYADQVPDNEWFLFMITPRMNIMDLKTLFVNHLVHLLLCLIITSLPKLAGQEDID